MYVSGSLKMGKIEVQEQVDIGINLGHGYMISTFQIHISIYAAVKGVSWAVFCFDGAHSVSIYVTQCTMGGIGYSYVERWI